MPSMPTLALSAAIGLSLGMGLVWLTIKAPPPGMTSELVEPVDSDDSEPEAGEEADAESEAEAEEAEAEAEAEAGAEAVEPTLRFRRGRVAYIRCGALDRCPRDRELEDAVWALLETLPTCPDGPRSPGTGDVRVHFGRDGVELRFRDWGGSPLALRPLRTCLESGISNLSTRLGVRPLSVSFRFELRPLG
jgi:hypothetical protein